MGENYRFTLLPVITLNPKLQFVSHSSILATSPISTSAVVSGRRLVKKNFKAPESKTFDVID